MYQQGQPIDRNPHLPCDVCGEEYQWQDYWKGRLDNPHEDTWRCDRCYNDLIEAARQERRRARNNDITNYQ